MTTKQFEGLYLPADSPITPPYVDGNKFLVNGELREWTGNSVKVKSPILRQGKDEPTIIGVSPMMGSNEALEALDAAVKAFNHGRGEWPKAHVSERIKAVEAYLAGLKQKRDEIVNLLMWEICKNKADAQKEVDRTITYIVDTINELKNMENSNSTFIKDSGVAAQIRRAPLGVVLCLGPFNYPFNETYTTLIPAIIMGNTVVMKLPRVGVLCHTPTLELFKTCFPKGVVNVISGSGHTTMPPIMATGKIDVFAFIGTSNAADQLQKGHPKPHRLRICLGLEAKNPAIVTKDANIAVAVRECVLGSFSFNGQRCTAIKIIFVHKDIEQQFLDAFVKAVDSLVMGLPWDGASITPLPEEGKPGYIQDLIDDAISKGAKIVNPRGGKIDRTWVTPTVVYPVTPQMRVYNEEQFGPLIPVRSYETNDDIFEYLDQSPYGQQAAVFSTSSNTVSELVDVLVNQVSRVNINSQCQRGPDSFPFTGRKDSAYGTLSVHDALRVFSIRALVACKDEPANHEIVDDIVKKRASNFLRLDYMF